MTVYVDPLAPDSTVYQDQGTGASVPSDGGPMLAQYVRYDPVVSGLAANDVQAAIDLIDNRLDTISGAGGLESRVAVLEAEMDTAQADIDAAEANIVTLQGRMTTAETAITALGGRMTAAEASITDLQGRMTTAEASIVTQNGRLDALEAADVSLDTRLDAAEANITTLQGKTNQATETVAGIAEIATTAEVTAGADDARIVTPAKLAARIAAIPAVPAATETVAGIAEIATQAETNAVADDARIVTAKKLGVYVAAQIAALNLATTYVGKAGTQQMEGPLGIGAAAPAGVQLHVQNATLAEARIQTGAAANAVLKLLNTVRTNGILTNSAGDFVVYDYTNSAERLSVNGAGLVTVPGTLSCPGGLTGGEGNAGRLRCYNTANYVTFSWSGTQLFARIDNGGAIVALN